MLRKIVLCLINKYIIKTYSLIWVGYFYWLNMEKQDLCKFIGIPYEFLGTTFNGADCIGLCQLFFNQHGFDIEFRDGREITKDWYETEPLRLLIWLNKNFTKINSMENLQYGDIVLFEINGESHTGIFIGNMKVLTILETFKKSMIIHLRKQNIFYQCGFRMKE